MGCNGFNNMFKTHRIKLVMSMSNFLVVILVLVCTGSTRAAATARPLEHSPGELAWAAWLEQENRTAEETQHPHRRITTKSLFVFPHLGSQALPDCSEGYRPDSMGRCVKVVNVVESAHLEFLLQKLNSQFANETAESQDEIYDYEIDTEPTDGNGPFQLNIPIAMQVQGHKSDDSEGSGDNVILFKKESKPQAHIPNTKPTSDAVDNKNVFNLDDAIRNTRNTTHTGVTVLVSTNGKFENVTSNKDDDLHHKSKPNEDTIDETTTYFDETTTEFITSTMPSDTTLDSATQFDFDTTTITNFELSEMSKDTNKGDIIILSNQNGENDRQPLLDQIEALKFKDDDEDVKPNNKIVGKNPSDEAHHNAASNHHASSDHILKTMDIEDKIKVISRFADVTRNTEDDSKLKHHKIDYQKKASEEKENFMHSQYHNDNAHNKPSDSAASATGLLHYPYNSYGSQKLHEYEKNKPTYNSHGNGAPNQKPPYWWVPQSWNTNNPRNEQDLLTFLSRMPIAPEYPYGTYPAHNQRPHYQTIYPNPHQSGGRINLRHTQVTHRRGRPMFSGDIQSEHEEPLLYGRGRHPHYRE